MSKLGDKIVANYMASSEADRKPGGDCFAVAYDRVNKAHKEVCGSSLPAIDAFDRLWVIKIDAKSTWLKLEKKYRGKGSAGVMASHSKGCLLTSTEIWAGKLEPGAVVQTWRKTTDDDRVGDGDPAKKYGFSGYVRLVLVRKRAGEKVPEKLERDAKENPIEDKRTKPWEMIFGPADHKEGIREDASRGNPITTSRVRINVTVVKS